MAYSEHLALACSLIGIRDHSEALAFVAHYFQGFEIVPFEKEGIRSLLVLSHRFKSHRDFKILLNVHLDVVSARDVQFTPVIQEGKLFGRGAYDMKAAAAVEMLVFKELVDTLDYPLGLQVVTDEEVGGFRGTKYQVDCGVRAEFVIVGEPTNLAIGNKAKGILWLKIIFQGKSAHGAYLWQGRNAVCEMMHFLERLQSVYPVPTEEVWQTTVNVAQVVTENSAYNTVPDRCDLKLDVRFVPEDQHVVLDIIKMLLPADAQLEIILHESSQFTACDNPYLVRLQSCCSDVLGVSCQVVARHGGSDLRFFDQVGVKGVEFGPVGYGHHTDDEWVDLASLDRYYEVLLRFLSF